MCFRLPLGVKACQTALHLVCSSLCLSPLEEQTPPRALSKENHAALLLQKQPRLFQKKKKRRLNEAGIPSVIKAGYYVAARLNFTEFSPLKQKKTLKTHEEDTDFCLTAHSSYQLFCTKSHGKFHLKHFLICFLTSLALPFLLLDLTMIHVHNPLPHVNYTAFISLIC